MPYAEDRRLAEFNRRQRYRQHPPLVLDLHAVLRLLCLMCMTSVAAQQAENVSVDTPPPTLESDKDALLSIKEHLSMYSQKDDTLYTDWLEDSDPCIDEWSHVVCECGEGEVTFPFVVDICDALIPPIDTSRVLVLLLPGGEGEDEKWSGPLSPDFGRLDSLRFLDLGDNLFSGSIPRSFRNLDNLRVLTLSENKLNGSIPDFLGDFSSLRRLELQGNQFSGPVPAIGCSEEDDSDIRVFINDNEGLCEQLPQCMESVVSDLNGTYVYSPSIPDSGEASLVCDISPPFCDGCGLQLPTYWTSATEVHFVFAEFTDNESGIRRYEVRLSPVNAKNISRQDAAGISINITDLDMSVFTNLSPDNGSRRSIELVNVTYNLATTRQNLFDGARYNVTVIATNGAGPPLMANISDGPVIVDTTIPEETDVFNTPNLMSLDEQDTEAILGISWNGTFKDPQTGIHSVNVTVLELLNKPVNGSNETEVYSVSVRNNDRRWELNKTAFQLMADRRYEYMISVENNAGLVLDIRTDAFTLTTERNNILDHFLFVIGAACVFIFGGMTAAIILYYLLRINTRPRFDSDERLLEFMYEVLETGPEEIRIPSKPVMTQPELAFVITDEEGSTAQSERNEVAFKQLMQIHDMIIRDTYAEYSGYEIHTEGDSFQLAFASVASAVRFCISVQHKFLEFNWSQEILRLPSCAVVKDAHGKGPIFRGPRVRMAIHWAKSDLVSSRIHAFTKHRIFEGPAFETAKELSDAAAGGQILMSHDAWLNFTDDFPKAGFPTVEQLGTYTLDTRPEATLVYNVNQQVGKKLIRTFPTLRKLRFVNKGMGILIVPPPEPDDKGCLTFMALQIHHPVMEDPNSPILDLTVEIIARHAQHYQGHIFQTRRREGVVMLVFADALQAMRYAFVVQMALVLQNWPSEVMALCGPLVPGPDQVPMFNGPRVAIAIHYTRSFGVTFLPSGADPSNRKRDYGGHGVCYARRLAAVAWGGQNIISTRTWSALQDSVVQDSVQNSLPPRSQVLNLGKHIVDDQDDNSEWLFEVMPLDLASRNFPSVKSKNKIESGYGDAPSTDKDIAIVFVKVDKPQTIRRYEERKKTATVPESEMHETLAVYYQSVSIFGSVVQARLRSYDGYFCKEPEPGKFTLAFSCLRKAILWACHVHAELLSLDWPEKLLTLDECKGEIMGERWIHRGLKVKIGMAYGSGIEKRPLSTGRADYCGMLSNIAARVSTLARPGQVLIHSSTNFDICGVHWISEDAGILKYDKPLVPTTDGAAEVAVEVSKLGMFLLRNVNELKMLYQAQPASIAFRERFGSNDVADMYNQDSHNKMPTVSRFWNHLRFRNPLRYLPEPVSSFLSYNFTNRPTLVGSSNSRPVSPPISHTFSSSDMLRLESGKWSALTSTIHTQIEEGQLDEEHPPNDLEAAPSLNPSPQANINGVGDVLPPSVFGPSSSRPFQESSNSGQGTESNEISPITQEDSGQMDDYVISFGNSTSLRVVPPVEHRSSSEEASPLDYGNQVASLYSNVAGPRRSAEFSFHSQRSDSQPDVN